MSYKALFLGSIGVVAETSELQRLAFNAAFEQSGLDWQWDRATYQTLLTTQGGRARIAAFGASLGQDVDADLVYRRKQACFTKLARATRPELRAGVLPLLTQAKRSGMARAFVTSTTSAQVDLALRASGGVLRRADFDYVGDVTRVAAPKPAPDIYHDALRALSVGAGEVLCIEDTPESAAAALSAGLRVVGFPGDAAQGREFPDGVPVVEFLSPMLLRPSPLSVAAA